MAEPLHIEFVNGPLDGVADLWPGDVKAIIQVEGSTEGYYQLHVRAGEEPPPPSKESDVQVLELSNAQIERRYRYFWINRPLK